MRNANHSWNTRPHGSANYCAEWPAPNFTHHARKRGAQRNLSADSVRYILAFGREYQRTGGVFYMLGRRDIPPEDFRDTSRARLVGAIALVSADGVVITVYRNGAAARAIARKMKYRISWKTEGRRLLHSGDSSEDA
jgi:hypothetical protein